MLEIKPSNVKIWSRLSSRGTFGAVLCEMAETIPNLTALTADVTASAGLERFRKTYPERFYNVGIAEQNMIGIASGLSKLDNIVFAASFAPFITMRCCEQIRINLGYMQMNVKLVGIGSGLALEYAGNSHFGIEDVSVIRSIPNITILSPADCTETVKATVAAALHKGPVYLRLTGGNNNPIVYSEDYDFEIGKAITLKEGHDVAVIATGTMVYNALKAAELLQEQGISCTVVDMHTIKPIDKETIDKLLSHKLIITVEEHNVVGGLGSAVAEYLCSKKDRPQQLIIGINDFYPKAGDYQYLLDQCGLTPEKIAKRISRTLLEDSYVF